MLGGNLSCRPKPIPKWLQGDPKSCSVVNRIRLVPFSAATATVILCVVAVSVVTLLCEYKEDVSGRSDNR